MSFNPKLLRRRLPAFGTVARLDFAQGSPEPGFPAAIPRFPPIFRKIQQRQKPANRSNQ
jgi:hypothetical protein